jgi:hypothetical protein
MTSASRSKGEDVAAVAASLTEVQRRAISIAIFLVGDWVLTTDYEDHPDIQDDLSEDIADPVSGILTPLGCQIRAHLTDQEGQNR